MVTPPRSAPTPGRRTLDPNTSPEERIALALMELTGGRGLPPGPMDPEMRAGLTEILLRGMKEAPPPAPSPAAPPLRQTNPATDSSIPRRFIASGRPGSPAEQRSRDERWARPLVDTMDAPPSATSTPSLQRRMSETLSPKPMGRSFIASGRPGSPGDIRGRDDRWARSLTETMDAYGKDPELPEETFDAKPLPEESFDARLPEESFDAQGGGAAAAISGFLRRLGIIPGQSALPEESFDAPKLPEESFDAGPRRQPMVPPPSPGPMRLPDIPITPASPPRPRAQRPRPPTSGGIAGSSSPSGPQLRLGMEQPGASKFSFGLPQLQMGAQRPMPGGHPQVATAPSGRPVFRGTTLPSEYEQLPADYRNRNQEPQQAASPEEVEALKKWLMMRRSNGGNPYGGR